MGNPTINTNLSPFCSGLSYCNTHGGIIYEIDSVNGADYNAATHPFASYSGTNFAVGGTTTTSSNVGTYSIKV